MASLGTEAEPWTVTPQLDSPKDPTRASRSWIRASFRIAPPSGTRAFFLGEPEKEIRDISLFEYYWAPIIQDKISYIGSLLFLIRAGLQPFLYIGSNLNALRSAGPSRLPIIVIKEIWRQACLFVPLLLLVIFLLWSIQDISVAALSLPIHLNLSHFLTVIALGIRYLYLISCLKALRDSFQLSSGWQTDPRWRLALVGGILFHLAAWPFFFAPTLAGLAWLGVAAANTLSSLVNFGSSHIAHALGILSWIPQYLALLSSHLKAAADPVFFPHGAALRTRVGALLLIDHRLHVYLHDAFTLFLLYASRLILITYIGDVAVYVNSNELSKSYAARTQIIEECSATLADLLTRQDTTDPVNPRPMYDRVLIAAHSLGAVIAYDTVTQLLNVARTAQPGPGSQRTFQPEDLDNLRGMVTFGSPLNKVFYFFREQGDPRQTLRRQTLDLLHGYRLAIAACDDPGTPAFSPARDPQWTHAEDRLTDGFRWINAYSLQDPISSRIVFYDCFPQQRFIYPPFIAHLRYWEDPDFYIFVRSNLL